MKKQENEKESKLLKNENTINYVTVNAISTYQQKRQVYISFGQQKSLIFQPQQRSCPRNRDYNTSRNILHVGISKLLKCKLGKQ